WGDVCRELGMRRQQPVAFDRDRPGEHFRIVERHLEIHVAEVAAAHALREPKRFGLWMSAAVEPRLVVESRGRHDEGVALPSPDRVSQPRRVRIWGEIEAVGYGGV